MAGKRARATPGWAQVPPDERQYYRDAHGFDPVNALISLTKIRGFYRYEEWFPLAQDLGLHAAGIEVGARVEIDGKVYVHNRIMFRQGNKEAAVECTHTVVFAGPVAEMPTFATDDGIAQGRLSKRERQYLSQAGGPAQLPPWGHFAALKSYVAGIAEAGIANMMQAMGGQMGKIKYSDDGETPQIVEPVPFGFNAAMQMQILTALRTIAPESSLPLIADWCIYLLETTPKEWLEARRNGPLGGAFSKDLLAYLWNHSPSEWLVAHWNKIETVFWFIIQDFTRKLGENEWINMDPALLHALMYQSVYGVPDAIIENLKVPRNIIEELLRGTVDHVRKAALEALEVRSEDDVIKAQKGWLCYNGIYVQPQDHAALTALQQTLGAKIICRNGNRPPPLIFGTPEKVYSGAGFWVTGGRVTRLELSNCELKDLPREMRLFAALRDLNLYHNKFETLPEVIGDLIAVENLELDDNKLKELPPCLGRLQSLKSLDCSTNVLITLPDAIGDLRSLENVELRHNNFSILPGCLGKLQSLKNLDASENHIRDILPAIENWPLLERLDLSRNVLPTIPVAIRQMKNLKRLNLSSNQFKELPPWFFNLTSLKILNLGYSHLTIPDAICNLQGLEYLNFSSSRLKTLPRSLVGLHELNTLKVEGNELTEFPSFLQSLPQLEELDLHINHIRELPKTLEGFDKLRLLDLSNNVFENISEAIGRLPALTLLNLMGNDRMTAIPESIFLSHSLRRIDVNKDLAREIRAKGLNKRGIGINHNWDTALRISH